MKGSNKHELINHDPTRRGRSANAGGANLELINRIEKLEKEIED